MRERLLALYLARRDPRIPLKAKLAVALAVAYFFSPVDLIPDFIPVVGQLDELVVVSALLGLAMRWIPAGVIEEYLEQARVEFSRGPPVSYALGAVVVGLWLFSIAALIFIVSALVSMW